MKFTHYIQFCILNIFTLFTASVFAQSDFCGTRVVDQEKSVQSISAVSQHFRPDQGIQYVPLKIHTVANDNASSFYIGWQVFETLCTLNEDFLPTGIQFFLEEDFNYIKNTSWNNHEGYERGEEMMVESNVPNMVNCYLVSNPAGNCGYFTYQGDGIALNKTCLGKTSHTWAHELGHFFSLPHTFFGWEGINYSNGKKTSEYAGQVSRQIENIVRTQCKRQGDLFCDTYPDYISNRWTCNEDGKSSMILRDLQDSTFRADGTLFMSYSNDQCMNRFAVEQMDAMHKSLNGPRAELLRPQVQPKMIDQSELSLEFPLDSLELSGTDVLLRWEEVPNARYYVIQISRTSNFSVIVKNLLLTKPEVLVDSLTSGKNFWWRVRAYSEFDFCGAESKVGYFKTQPTIVGTGDLIKGQVLLYPNPVAAGGKTFFRVKDSNQHIQQIQMMSLNGHVIAMPEFFQANEGIVISIPSDLNGMHIIRIVGTDSSYLTKINIQY